MSIVEDRAASHSVNLSARSGPSGARLVTRSEKELDFRKWGKPARSPLPTVKTAVVVALVLVYAVGFAILFPIAQKSVAESAAQGNDPALLQFVSP